MRLRSTQTASPRSGKEILAIAGLFAAAVLLATIGAYAFFPSLFGVQTTVKDAWVAEFVNDVNAVRASHNEAPLILESNLTLFAQSRAAYWIAHYQSSDLAEFENASSQFFGANVVVVEAAVYPSGYTPSSYLSVLYQYSPNTYQIFLTNSTYGYAITVGPYYAITTPSCTTYSVPPNTDNITQYLVSRGCQFKIDDVTWLVFEFSK